MDIKELEAKIKEFQAREEELIARQGAATSDRQRFELERLRRFNEISFESFLENERLRDLLGRIEHPDSKSQRAA